MAASQVDSAAVTVVANESDPSASALTTRYPESAPLFDSVGTKSRATTLCTQLTKAALADSSLERAESRLASGSADTGSRTYSSASLSLRSELWTSASSGIWSQTARARLSSPTSDK